MGNNNQSQIYNCKKYSSAPELDCISQKGDKNASQHDATSLGGCFNEEYSHSEETGSVNVHIPAAKNDIRCQIQEEKLRGDYIKALKRGKVKVAYARVMLLGAGGTGKTSVYHGLMNQEFTDTNSTQLAEISTVTHNWAKSGKAANEQWVPVENELDELVGLVRLVVNVNSGRCKDSRRFVSMMKAGIDEITAAIKVTRKVSTKYDHILQEILTESIRVLQKNPTMQADDFDVFMHVWDCGGKPIFLSILPAFLTAKTLILLTFDARKGLHDRCITSSHHGKNVTTEHVEEVTTVQFLLQWMSYIDATLSSQSDDACSQNNYPQILPVGTHGDDPEVKLNKKKIIQQLYLEYMDKACAKMLPEKGTVIDNTTAGKGKDEDGGYKWIRRNIHKFALEQLSIDTPLTWVLFRIVLRRIAKTQPYISLEDIEEIARACSVEEGSLSKLLEFYHSLGVFLHYTHIPSLKSQVIANPQWLINQFAKLFSTVSTEPFRNPAQSDLLSKKGILVQPLYEQIWKFTQRSEDKNGLQAQAIVDLLEHFLIVAPIDTGSKIHQFQCKEYFVPGVLPLASLSEPMSTSRGAIKKAAPLHLIFNTKYLPPGFFTRFATSLSKQPTCQVSFTHGIYRNRVTFLFGEPGLEIDTVTITEHIYTVQIDLQRDIQRQERGPFFSSVCQNVMQIIINCCNDVSKWVPFIHASTAFQCNDCIEKKNNDEHFIDLSIGPKTDSVVRCQLEKPHYFNTEQKHWLQVGKVVICPSESDVHDLEIEAISIEIVKTNKIKELANTLEMTVHLPLPPDDILNRWQKEMKLMNLPPRHYLIHHLICIGLSEMAHKLSYCEIYPREQISSVYHQPLPKIPLTTLDLVTCSKAINNDESIKKIAGYLDITHRELEDIKSEYTDYETQAYQTFKRWHTRCISASKEDLASILKATGCDEASKHLSGSEPTLEDLVNHVKTTKYYQMGIALGLSRYTLNVIESDSQTDVEKALLKVFQKWLDTCSHPTWGIVIKALNDIDENWIAKSISEIFFK